MTQRMLQDVSVFSSQYVQQLWQDDNMPTFEDIRHFLTCQLLGRTTLPDVDLSGQTIIVTGANTGLGLDASKHLYDLYATWLVHHD